MHRAMIVQRAAFVAGSANRVEAEHMRAELKASTYWCCASSWRDTTVTSLEVQHCLPWLLSSTPRAGAVISSDAMPSHVRKPCAALIRVRFGPVEDPPELSASTWRVTLCPTHPMPSSSFVRGGWMMRVSYRVLLLKQLLLSLTHVFFGRTCRACTCHDRPVITPFATT